MMAETSDPILYSQALLDASIDSSVAPQGLTQSARQKKYKPRFAEFMCSHQEVSAISYGCMGAQRLHKFQVSRYVSIVTNAVIPRHFWGCKKNLELILKRNAVHLPPHIVV